MNLSLSLSPYFPHSSSFILILLSSRLFAIDSPSSSIRKRWRGSITASLGCNASITGNSTFVAQSNILSVHQHSRSAFWMDRLGLRIRLAPLLRIGHHKNIINWSDSQRAHTSSTDTFQQLVLHIDWYTLLWEISSVNRKFQDNCKPPSKSCGRLFTQRTLY